MLNFTSDCDVTEDFFRDLQEEFRNWEATASSQGKPKSLWEELAVTFLCALSSSMHGMKQFHHNILKSVNSGQSLPLKTDQSLLPYKP